MRKEILKDENKMILKIVTYNGELKESYYICPFLCYNELEKKVKDKKNIYDIPGILGCSELPATWIIEAKGNKRLMY